MSGLTNNFWRDRVKDGKKYYPTALCLHITDGSLEGTLAHIKNPASQVSYNWLFHKGEFIEVVKESDAAWANGLAVKPTWKGYDPKVNSNLRTISVGVISRGGFPNVLHWFAWAKGCRDICKRNNIPMDNLGIVNHNEIRIDKTCPGDWYNKRWFLFLKNFV